MYKDVTNLVNGRNVLISASYFEPAHLGGGPIQTLKALVAAAPNNFSIKLICHNHDFGKVDTLVDTPDTWMPVNGIRVRYTSKGYRNLINGFRSSKNLDLLYLNSLFNFSFSILPLLLWKTGVLKSQNVLLAPRGELDPGALNLKSPKKKAFIQAFKLLRLHRSITWHASSPLEKEFIHQNFGQKVKVIVKENETSLPSSIQSRKKRTPGTFRIIFASRLHEKKGLHVLLKALKETKRPVKVEIIGAFEDASYKKLCLELARSLPIDTEVTFKGPLPREQVLIKFAESDLFTFPTAGENFGHVIAESLSQSCPVMCSNTTPWSNRIQENGGILIDSLDSQSWSSELNRLLAASPEKWLEMSHKATSAYNLWRSEPKGQHVFESAVATA